MNKKILIILAALAIVSVVTVPVFAMKAGGPSAVNGLTKSKNTHLYLYEKDPDEWFIIEDGLWGKLNINVKQNSFVFNAHGMTPEISYELICYLDPWPGAGSTSFGTAVADEEGKVHIQGVIALGALPLNEDVGGSKIWLVLDADFDGTQMTAWNPTSYLFEYDLLSKVSE